MNMSTLKNRVRRAIEPETPESLNRQIDDLEARVQALDEALQGEVTSFDDGDLMRVAQMLWQLREIVGLPVQGVDDDPCYDDPKYPIAQLSQLIGDLYAQHLRGEVQIQGGTRVA